MKILHREGSLVILEDKLGRIWLTKRKKYKHTSRRRKWSKVKTKGWSVRYRPIQQMTFNSLPDHIGRHKI